VLSGGGGSLRRADHSSRGVIPCVIVKPGCLVDHDPLGVVALWKKAVVMEMVQAAKKHFSLQRDPDLISSKFSLQKSSSRWPFFCLYIRCD